MIEPRIRGIDDVGLRLPQGLTEEMATPFMEHVVHKAAALRSVAMANAGPAVVGTGDPWARLKFVTDILRTGILPQADRTVAEFAVAGAAKIQCRSGCRSDPIAAFAKTPTPISDNLRLPRLRVGATLEAWRSPDATSGTQILGDRRWIGLIGRTGIIGLRK